MYWSRRRRHQQQQQQQEEKRDLRPKDIDGRCFASAVASTAAAAAAARFRLRTSGGITLACRRFAVAFAAAAAPSPPSATPSCSLLNRYRLSTSAAHLCRRTLRGPPLMMMMS